MPSSQNGPQRHDRLRRSRLRDPLGAQRKTATSAIKPHSCGTVSRNSSSASCSSPPSPPPTYSTRSNSQASRIFLAGHFCSHSQESACARIGDMRKQGLRPFVVGALGEVGHRRPHARPSLRRRQISALTERQLIRRGTACRARTPTRTAYPPSPHVAVRPLIAIRHRD